MPATEIFSFSRLDLPTSLKDFCTTELFAIFQSRKMEIHSIAPQDMRSRFFANCSRAMTRCMSEQPSTSSPAYINTSRVRTRNTEFTLSQKVRRQANLMSSSNPGMESTRERKEIARLRCLLSVSTTRSTITTSDRGSCISKANHHRTPVRIFLMILCNNMGYDNA